MSPPKPVHHLTGEPQDDRRAALLTPKDHEAIARFVVSIIKKEGLGVNHECILGFDQEEIVEIFEFLRGAKANHDYFTKTLKRYAIKTAIVGIIATFLVGLSVKLGLFINPLSAPVVPPK